jgi:thiol-disulfide isomerase/thioredoxin
MRLRALLVLPISVAMQGCGASTDGTTARANVSGVEIAGLARVEQAIAEHRGHPLLLNFWATWCPPCVEELPGLLAVAKEHESGGLQVLGLSFDMMLPNKQPDEVIAHVRGFLDQRGLALPTLILEGADFEATSARFDLPGGIPVTLAIDRAGNVVDRHEGQGSREHFERLARKALGP